MVASSTHPTTDSTHSTNNKMKTSTFLSTLRTNSSLPLVFGSLESSVAPGYHLTEVKDVAYRTMDCGAMTHRWVETQFEVWVPSSAQEAADRGFMSADKFLRIVDRVQKVLPLDGESEARIFVSLGTHPASLYSIEAIGIVDGRLFVELGEDRARCKARERSEAAAPGTGCGCGSNTERAGPVACCA
jgi:hypothetical protein